MSNKIVVSQVLEEIANKLDEQGQHDLADEVTEDLKRVASGGNIRTAFLKKLFRGVGKAFRNPAFQALALQQLQKYLNRPAKTPQPNQNDPWGWMRNLGQQPNPNDFATPQDYQNYLNTLSGQTTPPTPLPPSPSTPPTNQQSGQTGYLFGLSPQIIQQQKYYQYQMQKAKNPQTNIPALIQQINQSNLPQSQKQEIINIAKKTFESSNTRIRQ